MCTTAVTKHGYGRAGKAEIRSRCSNAIHSRSAFCVPNEPLRVSILVITSDEILTLSQAERGKDFNERSQI